MSKSDYNLIIERGDQRELVNIPVGEGIGVNALRRMIDNGLITDDLEEITGVVTVVVDHILGGLVVDPDGTAPVTVTVQDEVKVSSVTRLYVDGRHDALASSDEGTLGDRGLHGTYQLIATTAHGSVLLSKPVTGRWTGAYQSFMAKIIGDETGHFGSGNFKSLVITRNGKSAWRETNVTVAFKHTPSRARKVTVTAS